MRKHARARARRDDAIESASSCGEILTEKNERKAESGFVYNARKAARSFRARRQTENGAGSDRESREKREPRELRKHAPPKWSARTVKLGRERLSRASERDNLMLKETENIAAVLFGDARDVRRGGVRFILEMHCR